jgi:hypothetical protein
MELILLCIQVNILESLDRVLVLYESYSTLLFIFKNLNLNLSIDHVIPQINCPLPNGLMIIVFDMCCNVFIVARMKHIVL